MSYLEFPQKLCVESLLLYIHDCHKSGKKSYFSEKFSFLCYQLDAVVFWFFTRTNQNQSGATEWPAVERRQDQHELGHV